MRVSVSSCVFVGDIVDVRDVGDVSIVCSLFSLNVGAAVARKGCSFPLGKVGVLGVFCISSVATSGGSAFGDSGDGEDG